MKKKLFQCHRCKQTKKRKYFYGFQLVADRGLDPNAPVCKTCVANANVPSSNNSR